MRQFEYDVTKHSASDFTHLVFFCTGEGECKIDQVPTGQTTALLDILNERGSEGWELIQTLFGKDGTVMIWKREMRS